MKKILFLLLLIYSYGFSWTSAEQFAKNETLKTGTFKSIDVINLVDNYGNPIIYARSFEYDSRGSQYVYNSGSVRIYYKLGGTIKNDDLCKGFVNGVIKSSGGIHKCSPETGEDEFIINPDPLGGPSCREGFVKDGQYHNCNPNTNESELVPNSNDYQLNENQTPYPKCNEGFVNDSTLVVSGGTSYTKQSCVVPAPDPESGSGTTNPVLDGVTTTTNADGSTTITWGDGTTQTVQTNGNSVTRYPDGTTTSSGAGGSTGGGSGSASSGGSPTPPPLGANTPNETNPNTNDTPVDTAPVANSCTSSNLTLQEKMMCEMNAGMKKLNSESSTQNSLNNLLKDLNSSNSQSLTAINKNIKYTNDNLEVINKNTNEVNQNLEVVANKVNQSNSELKAINETLKNIQTNTKDTSTNTSRTISVGGGTGETSGDGENGQLTSINNNLQDAEGKAHLETISNSLKSITGAGTDGTGNSEQGNQLKGNLTGTLNSTFSKYSNVLGFGSGFGNPPSNITLVLFGTTYTLIDFSLLEQHVSIIRALFLSLAYLYGFLFFLRGGK